MKTCVLIAGALAASPLAAQTLDDGTVDVYFQQISRQGELEGCSLVFTALTADHAYRNGKQIILNGSLAVRTLSGKDLLFTGKLGTRQMVQSGEPGKWEEPVHFYFASKNGTTAKDAKITASDTPGYKLLIARATATPVLKVLEEMGDAGEFTVGFNRKQGGQDVYSRIKINVALKRDANGVASRVTNEATSREFFECFSQVLDGVKKQLSK